MSISKEFLMEAVGLSLLVALLLISVQMFQRAVKLSSLFEEKQQQQMAELEEYEITKYDGLVIDGMTVINYVKRMLGNYGIPVCVANAVGDYKISDSSDYGKLRDINSDKYINPLSEYRCMVVRDENEEIIEITINLEMEGD